MGLRDRLKSIAIGRATNDLSEPIKIQRPNAPSANRLLNVPELNEHTVCPHCQTKGSVTKKRKTESDAFGINGTKVLLAPLTLGLSLLSTTRENHRKLTEAHCTKCDSTWSF